MRKRGGERTVLQGEEKKETNSVKWRERGKRKREEIKEERTNQTDIFIINRKKK